MPSTAGFTNFSPDTDIRTLKGKVIFITGGTAGLGYQSVLALAKHGPEHIYFTGRNAEAGKRLVDDVSKQSASSSIAATFLQMDMSALASVKSAVRKGFVHDRLDILMCNAGIMAAPPALSKDGYETQFATNHLAHAMIIRELLPVLQRTADEGADVRIVSLTSAGWQMHPKGGVRFDTLDTVQEGLFGSWVRYGQSKFANVVYARELAKRYPKITAVSIHPGISTTGLLNNQSALKRRFVHTTAWMRGLDVLPPEKAFLNQLWAAAGADKDKLVNGGYYTPIGVCSDDEVKGEARDPTVAEKLWEWTQAALNKI